MRFNASKFIIGMSLLGAFTAPTSQAEIVLHGTRVIYPSDAREVTLQMSNSGSKPSLVQAWIDDGDPNSTPDQAKAPFMISPPISRVEAEKSQTLRITALPTTKQYSQSQETVLWLNVIDIPPRPTGTDAEAAPENFLQLAIRSRIKLFYRPSSLKEDINLAADKIQWAKSGNTLKIKNPTPFHITMTSVLQKNGTEKIDLLPEGLMLSPFSEDTLQLKNANINDMSFIHINDYGGRIEKPIKL